MKVEDALYHACHDYEGGIGSLAPRMGVPENTLYHMANPRDLAHPWSLKRFRQVLAFTGDKRPRRWGRACTSWPSPMRP